MFAYNNTNVIRIDGAPTLEHVILEHSASAAGDADLDLTGWSGGDFGIDLFSLAGYVGLTNNPLAFSGLETAFGSVQSGDFGRGLAEIHVDELDGTGFTQGVAVIINNDQAVTVNLADQVASDDGNGPDAPPAEANYNFIRVTDTGNEGAMITVGDANSLIDTSQAGLSNDVIATGSGTNIVNAGDGQDTVTFGEHSASVHDTVVYNAFSESTPTLPDTIFGFVQGAQDANPGDGANYLNTTNQYAVDQGDVLYLNAGPYTVSYYEVSGAGGIAAALAAGAQGQQGVVILDTDNGHLYIDADGGADGFVDAQINLVGVTDLDQGNFANVTLVNQNLP
jgi:hypothetical protein